MGSSAQNSAGGRVCRAAKRQNRDLVRPGQRNTQVSSLGHSGRSLGLGLPRPPGRGCRPDINHLLSRPRSLPLAIEGGEKQVSHL